MTRIRYADDVTEAREARREKDRHRLGQLALEVDRAYGKDILQEFAAEIRISPKTLANYCAMYRTCAAETALAVAKLEGAIVASKIAEPANLLRRLRNLRKRLERDGASARSLSGKPRKPLRGPPESAEVPPARPAPRSSTKKE